MATINLTYKKRALQI